MGQMKGLMMIDFTLTDSQAKALAKEYVECRKEAMRWERIDADCPAPHGNGAARHRAAIERRRMAEIRHRLLAANRHDLIDIPPVSYTER